jgi:23S rRNA pseudouridine1911/1915/1917 synthase
MAEQEIEVSEERAGERLDAFLAERAGSRTNAAKLIAEGSVTVDGRPRQKRHTVVAGERVTIAEPEAPGGDAEPTASIAVTNSAFGVSFEDPYLLVIDKPAGLVVHPGKGNWEGTLSQALGLSVERGGVVHRLDKETSGLLVVAKTERVQRELQALIKDREVHREYLALVAGRPDSRTGTIDAPIGRDRHTRTIHSLDTDTPRDARTHFEIAEALATTTLLRVRLETGRTHQIRVHMQAIGHPVVGDLTYGGPQKYELSRQFLHAARLGFVHPVTGEAVDIESPLPSDLQLALEAARAG